MELDAYLYEKVWATIRGWKEEGIYAISFFVYCNTFNTYMGFENYPEFSIGYNTELDCHYAPKLSEERWNYAFWRQNIHEIIAPVDDDEGASLLLKWYIENGIENLGEEDFDNAYDENMHYIGKGPAGYYELLTVISNIARRLQTEKKITAQFGNIPIIVHDLEYPWYIEEATKNANPNGEADVFLRALQGGFE